MVSISLFYIAILGGVYLSFTRSAVFAFVTYELFYFFNPDVRWWGPSIISLPYSMMLVLLMLVFVLRDMKKNRENKIKYGKPLLWAYFVGLLYAVAYFYAVFPENHYVYLTYFIKLLIIVTLAYKLIVTKKDFDLALYGYIFGAWYISFYIFQVGRNSGGRVEHVGLSDAPDSNGLASALAPSLVLCVYYFWINSNKKLKVVFALAGVFIANALVLINSRGAFLGTAISMTFFMYYLYTSSFQRKYQKGFAIFLTVAGLAGVLYLADEAFIERMTGITSQVEVDKSKESGGTRIFYWKAAWEMAKDYPFGNGYRGFNFYAPEYLPSDLDTGGQLTRSVHSSWFETLSEIGYFGLIVFCSMIFVTYKSLSKVKQLLKERGLVNEYYQLIAIQAGFIAFIVTMTFMNRMRAEVLYWFIMYSASAFKIYVIGNNFKGQDDIGCKLPLGSK